MKKCLNEIKVEISNFEINYCLGFEYCYLVFPRPNMEIFGGARGGELYE